MANPVFEKNAFSMYLPSTIRTSTYCSIRTKKAETVSHNPTFDILKTGFDISHSFPVSTWTRCRWMSADSQRNWRRNSEELRIFLGTMTLSIVFAGLWNYVFQISFKSIRWFSLQYHLKLPPWESKKGVPSTCSGTLPMGSIGTKPSLWPGSTLPEDRMTIPNPVPCIVSLFSAKQNASHRPRFSETFPGLVLKKYLSERIDFYLELKWFWAPEHVCQISEWSEQLFIE